MINLKTILETISVDTEDGLPAILTGLGIADFTEYCEGPIRDSRKTTCAIMYDPRLSLNIAEERLPILFWLQLFEIDYSDSILYCNAVKDFIMNYDEHRIGMTDMEELTIDIIPIEMERTTECYLSALFTNQKDSCDT